MEIRTKFNINQFVWVIDENNGKWKVIDRFKIIGVRIEKDRIVDFTDYELDYGDGKHCLHLTEENCFATKEEAQKECDRRNGK
jgi:hypothetical protein